MRSLKFLQRRFSSLNGGKDGPKKSALFSKEELDQIFRPELTSQLQQKLVTHVAQKK